MSLFQPRSQASSARGARAKIPATARSTGSRSATGQRPASSTGQRPGSRQAKGTKSDAKWRP